MCSGCWTIRRSSGIILWGWSCCRSDRGSVDQAFHSFRQKRSTHKPRMIPFSPPRIDQAIVDEVVAALRSGWITTGPRTKRFEQELAAYCKVPAVLCLNSATAGLELMLRWFGVGPGDEVILPAYTYSATANVVVHCGATPVFTDVRDDFNMDPEAVTAAINERTKVIMPVDFGGWPCDYRALNELVRQPNVRAKFRPNSNVQATLGRILVLSDSAHSLGAWYHGQRAGSLTDCSVFSFHAVKNLTTAEGSGRAESSCGIRQCGHLPGTLCQVPCTDKTKMRWRKCRRATGDTTLSKPVIK